MPARQFELFCDVDARFLERVRSRGTGAEVNQSLDMLQCILAGKFLPRFTVRFHALGASSEWRGRATDDGSAKTKTPNE